MRFNRDYKLSIKLGNDLLEIKPPTRVTFTGTRFMSALSAFEISIYNLSPSSYKRMTKDPDTRAGQFEFNDYTFIFEGGYENNIGVIFAGQIHEASTVREGVNLITTISAIAGLHDLKYAFISQTISNLSVADFVISKMGVTKKGKISPEITKLKRAKVLLGNAFKILEDAYPEYNVIIDNNTCHILKNGETTTDFIPIVDASTGLIGTPTRVQQRVNFSTLLNSDITLGGNVELKATVDQYINGIYNVESIEYAGDNWSDSWLQNVTAYNYANKIKNT